MAEEPRRKLEIQAALKQIKDYQKRQTRKGGRRWRLDVSLPALAAQGLAVFVLGVLVGLGLFVLFRIILG